MQAIMNTKSNYKNCNGIRLEVVEVKGKRISCYVPYNGFNKQGKPNIKNDRNCIADFSIKELEELYN